MKTYKVICEVSARHHHPSEEGGYTKKADLSQGGHWVSDEKVEAAGMRFSVVLPPRPTVDGKGVFEVSISDWYKHLEGEPQFAGTFQVKLRHLHCDQETADAWGLVHGQKVSIEKKDGPRPGRLDNVDVRIDSWAVLRVHLDTDEANALYIKNGDTIDLIVE